MSGQGILVLGATPLGNPGDASPRLREELERADVVAAEDTRRLRRLGHDLGVTMGGRVVSLHDAVEKTRSEALLGDLMAGRRVLVVTDAGMPSVSDPGFRLVREAHEAGVPVTSLPGPSAVLAALVLSGLPVARFAFEGFLPRKAGDRRRRLASLATEERTMVFFEAPHRLVESLADMVATLGPDRQAAVCRELTKTYEEVKRGSLAELAEWSKEGVRGEITVVVDGASPEEVRSAAGLSTDAEIADAVATAMAEGLSRKDAAARVAQAAGLSKRRVYDVSLADRSPS